MFVFSIVVVEQFINFNNNNKTDIIHGKKYNFLDYE